MALTQVRVQSAARALVQYKAHIRNALCVCVYVCVRVYACVCMCVYASVYMFRHCVRVYACVL
jgi:hypothetical protein